MPDVGAIQENTPSHEPTWLGGVIHWLKSRERKILVGAIVLQLAVLLGMIALHSMPLLFGDTVLLRVVPVDPRDLFRGEYVILSYEFSRTPTSEIEGFRDISSREWKGRRVYVSLVPEADGKHWRASKVSINPPDGGTYIRGQIVGYNNLQFGIEAYYLQEGRGREYERAIRQQRLSAKVAVTSSGRVALRDLEIE
jgi:uncharacterized membrane-anchored protein